MLGGISIWQLLIILVIVMLLFGTKRIRNIGSDLGGALRGFKKGFSEDEEEQSAAELKADPLEPQPRDKEEQKKQQ